MPASNSTPTPGSIVRGTQTLFGECSRFAVFAVHTRDGEPMWFVADAEVTDEVTGGPAIIRQAATREAAIEGLA